MNGKQRNCTTNITERCNQRRQRTHVKQRDRKQASQTTRCAYSFHNKPRSRQTQVNVPRPVNEMRIHIRTLAQGNTIRRSTHVGCNTHHTATTRPGQQAQTKQAQHSTHSKQRRRTDRVDKSQHARACNCSQARRAKQARRASVWKHASGSAHAMQAARYVQARHSYSGNHIQHVKSAIAGHST